MPAFCQNGSECRLRDSNSNTRALTTTCTSSKRGNGDYRNFGKVSDNLSCDSCSVKNCS